MFKSIAWRESGRLQRLLPLSLVLLASFLFPGVIAAQEARDAASAASALNSPFDELNSRLHDAADRAVAAAVSAPAVPEAAIYATPAQTAVPQQETANSSERRIPSGPRVQRLRPVTDPILRSEGIPAEMVAVALVESGGQPAALSTKGARGVWQLMPETARRYGLVVSGTRDDRLDLVSATRAAARYLRDLHAQFGDWELVLAAYNAGEQAVQNAIQRAGSNSFAVLSQLRLLPAETRNYVPAVMSARSFFKQAATVAGESTSAAIVPKAGRSAQNFAGGKVFYAMNSSNPHVAADGP